jgi:hypothetical protein
VAHTNDWNMNNLNVVRGCVIMAIALVFGVGSLQYSIGHWNSFGPGLFPLIVSSLLFLIGLVNVVRAYFVETEVLAYNVKSIAVILLALTGFTLFSAYINMVLGIVFLVFCSALASTSYSWVRNLKTSLGLIAIAFLFRDLLGLQLPLF